MKIAMMMLTFTPLLTSPAAANQAASARLGLAAETSAAALGASSLGQARVSAAAAFEGGLTGPAAVAASGSTGYRPAATPTITSAPIRAASREVPAPFMKASRRNDGTGAVAFIVGGVAAPVVGAIVGAMLGGGAGAVIGALIGGAVGLVLLGIGVCRFFSHIWRS